MTAEMIADASCVSVVIPHVYIARWTTCNMASWLCRSSCLVARCPTSHRHVHHAADGESYNAELKARLATLKSQHGRIMRGPISSARTAELRKRRPRDRPQARPTNEGERGRQAVHNREHDDRSEPRNSLEAMLNDNRLDV